MANCNIQYLISREIGMALSITNEVRVWSYMKLHCNTEYNIDKMQPQGRSNSQRVLIEIKRRMVMRHSYCAISCCADKDETSRFRLKPNKLNCDKAAHAHTLWYHAQRSFIIIQCNDHQVQKDTQWQQVLQRVSAKHVQIVVKTVCACSRAAW